MNLSSALFNQIPEWLSQTTCNIAADLRMPSSARSEVVVLNGDLPRNGFPSRLVVFLRPSVRDLPQGHTVCLFPLTMELVH